MPKSKIAISLNDAVLRRLDHAVEVRGFKSRSQAVEAAIEESLDRLDRGRLARECAKLDPTYEKALAEEGLTEGLEDWPEY